MRKFIYALFSAALLVSTVSCVLNDVIDGDDPGSADDEAEVLLHLSVPGGFGSTRALTLPQEREIDNVYVLEFNATGVDVNDATDIPAMKLRYAPKKATVASNDVSLSVVLTPSEMNEKSILMCVANAEDIITSPAVFAALTAGATYAEVADAICGTIAGPIHTSGEAIPMWGNSPAITIQNNSNNTTSVSLTRAVARIDVGVGAEPENANDGTTTAGKWTWNGKTVDGDPVPFKLASVHVFRPNKKYSVVVDDPATKIESDGEVTATTLPGGQNNSFDYTPSPAHNLFLHTDVDDTNFCITQQIYVPEADTKITATGTKGDVNHTNRMAIVVGGYYSPDPANPNTTQLSYYRLDFADNSGALMNVLRNHLYQFNIDSVTGDGYDDPVEAYESQAINMSCDVVAWSDDESDVGFDGTWHMYLSTNEMYFNSDSSQTLTIDTDYPAERGGWTAMVSVNEDGTGGAPTWLTISDDGGNGSDTPLDISVTAESNITTADRTAWIIFKAGDRLKAKVKVLQAVAGVKAVYGVIGYIWNPGGERHMELTLDGDKDYYGNPAGEYQSIQNKYTVYVAYFKFGSLIPTTSQYKGAFSSADVVAWPEELTTTVEDTVTGTGQDAWDKVPYTSFAVNEGDGNEVNMKADPTVGLGDPCDYWFGDGDGTSATTSAWRLPTDQDNIDLIINNPGSSVVSDSYNEMGMDPGDVMSDGKVYYDWTQGLGSISDNNPIDVSVGVFRYPLQGGSVALPAAGQRDKVINLNDMNAPANGRVVNRGNRGCYWSSTAYTNGSNAARGRYLYFFQSGVNANNVTEFEEGNAVRCVKGRVATSLVVAPENVTFTSNEIPGVSGAPSNAQPKTITVTADGPWTAEITNGTNGGTDGFTLTAGTGVVIVSNTNETRLIVRGLGNGTFTVVPKTENNGTSTVKADRSMTFTAVADLNPTLTDSCVVTQERAMVQGVKAAQGVIGYIWAPGTPDHMKLTLDGDMGYFGNPPGEPQAVQNKHMVYVAYFKFGSLVAISSQKNGNFTSNDIVAWPSEWMSTTDDRAELNAAVTSSGSNAWKLVPVITSENGMISGRDLSAVTTATSEKGMGDPCVYWANKNGWGAGWRMPKAAENTLWVGGADTGTQNQIQWKTWGAGGSNYMYADTQSGSTSSYGVFDYWDNSRTLTLEDPGIGRFPVAAQTGRNALSEALTAVGYYNDSGVITSQGTVGEYWSSTAQSPSKSYVLEVGNTTVRPVKPEVFASGFAVRCVNL